MTDASNNGKKPQKGTLGGSPFGRSDRASEPYADIDVPDYEGATPEPAAKDAPKEPGAPKAPAAPAAAPVIAPAVMPAAAPAPVPAAAPVSAPADAEASAAVSAESEVKGKVVKSPLVGTFYAAPAEDADPFVKVGDSVKEGQVLAIVEAMKLMNEIESDFTGTVTEILVENGQAVEYGQPLFVIS